jgi:hypothetical protein
MEVEYLRSIKCREEKFYPPAVLGILDYNKKRIRDYLGWRRDMASWLLDTAQLYGIHPSTAEAAQSMLDRLATIDKDITEDFEFYQLSCFVCLLIARKMNESRKLFKKSEIQELSRECFSQEELDHMELHVLYSLQWRVQPPTTIGIADALLELIPLELVPDRAVIQERLHTLLRKAIVDARFLPFKASSIALASILIQLRPILKTGALNDIQERLEIALEYREAFEQELEQLQSLILLQEDLSIDPSHDNIDHPLNLSTGYLDARKPKSSVQRSTISTSPDASPRSVLAEK